MIRGKIEIWNMKAWDNLFPTEEEKEMKTVKLVVVQRPMERDHLQQVLGGDFRVITVFEQPTEQLQYGWIIFVDGWNEGQDPAKCKSWVFDGLCTERNSKNGFSLIGCPYKTF